MSFRLPRDTSDTIVFDASLRVAAGEEPHTSVLQAINAEIARLELLKFQLALVATTLAIQQAQTRISP